MSNRRLLLADDSLTIQKVVNLTFSDEGFDVQTVGDGDSALAAIYESRPDIVLADVNMPGADGYSICEKLRSNDATNKIPVILLVGSFEPFDEDRAGLVGADAFLTKPFQSIRQLISQVNELLEAVPSTNGHNEPDQSAPEPEPPAPQPVDDIDTLYSQSFAVDGSTEVEDDLEQSMSGFDDSGLDDEMIETSYLADKSSETLDFEIAGNNDDAESIREENAGLAPGIDQYFSEPETVTTGYETSPLDPFATQAELVNFSQPVADEPAEATESFDETIPIVDQEPVDPAVQEPFDTTPSTEPVGEYFTESERPFVPTESSEEPLGQMGIETVSFDPPAPSRSFDEIDLLDIPPFGSSETVELTTAERAEIMGSDKRAVSISPELMEIIVQKVVERISQKY